MISPSCLQTTVASLLSHSSSQTVPQEVPPMQTSTRPWTLVAPPTSLNEPLVQKAELSDRQTWSFTCHYTSNRNVLTWACDSSIFIVAAVVNGIMRAVDQTLFTSSTLDIIHMDRSGPLSIKSKTASYGTCSIDVKISESLCSILSYFKLKIDSNYYRIFIYAQLIIHVL